MCVPIRKKKFQDRRPRLSLDLYQDSRRGYRLLKTYLTGVKPHDKEARRLAELVRSRRELEILAGTTKLTEVKSNTASQCFSIVSPLVNKAVAKNLIHSNPAQSVKGIRHKKPARIFLTFEDEEKRLETRIRGEDAMGLKSKQVTVRPGYWSTRP